MKHPIKGSRCERKVSMDGIPGEESLGPPAAIPFKWEEAPGKAKPNDEEEEGGGGGRRVPQIKRDGDLYNLLLSKGDSLGHSSGSLYRSADLGCVPFEWEAEPGMSKTPDRVEPLVLVPPPGLQSPARLASPLRSASASTPRWSSQSFMKWVFHNLHHHQNKVYSGPVKSRISASQELGYSTVQSRYIIHKDDYGQRFIDQSSSQGSEFEDTSSESEEMKSVLCNAVNSAEKKREAMAEISMELEILMRFAQLKVGNKKAVKMHALRRGGLLSCLPLCLFTPRPTRIHGDCSYSHSKAASKSNDLHRGF